VSDERLTPSPELAWHQGLRRYPRVHYSQDPNGQLLASAVTADWIAVEEPLEIRISGERWLTTMRTPGHDRELTAGLLLSEGLIRSRDELGSLVHCGPTGAESYGNVLDVTLAAGAEQVWERLDKSTRRGVVSAACGVCGRDTILDLLARCEPLPAQTVEAAKWVAFSAALAAAQVNFQHTGGVHAAGLVSREGELFATFEDVGRHNAVDKVLGHRLLRGQGEDGLLLLVSGRASFEIVQKAIVARCAAVISISAPSSLAIETAARFNLALLGFTRGQSCNVYVGG
jgi:FdhD protein